MLSLPCTSYDRILLCLFLVFLTLFWAFLSFQIHPSELKQSLEAATKTSILKELRDAQLRRDHEDALALLERIPPEVLDEFKKPKAARRTVEL